MKKALDGNKKLVDFSMLSEMLYDEEKYIKEFSEAAVLSFKEFSDHYSSRLLERDETNFRKAGHKIKPVAQMLGVDEIVEEYEHAKTLIWDEKPDAELRKSAEKMTLICDQVIDELQELVKQN